MDDIILIIQIVAFIIITGVMILNVPLEPDKIEKDDKNEIISFLDLVKKIIPNEDLDSLGISEILNEGYTSKIPARYRGYIYLRTEHSPLNQARNQKKKATYFRYLVLY